MSFEFLTPEEHENGEKNISYVQDSGVMTNPTGFIHMKKSVVHTRCFHIRLALLAMHEKRANEA